MHCTGFSVCWLHSSDVCDKQLSCWRLTSLSAEMSFTDLACLSAVLHLCLQFVGSTWMECNEELNELYSSPNIVRVIKSRRVRWAGHVARMGEERVLHRS